MLKLVQQKVLSQQLGQFVTLKNNVDPSVQQVPTNVVQDTLKLSQNEKMNVELVDPNILESESKKQDDRTSLIEEKTEDAESKFETKLQETALSLKNVPKEFNPASENEQKKILSNQSEKQQYSNSPSKSIDSHSIQNASNTQKEQSSKLNASQTIESLQTDQEKMINLTQELDQAKVVYEGKTVQRFSQQSSQTDVESTSHIKVERSYQQRIMQSNDGSKQISTDLAFSNSQTSEPSNDQLQKDILMQTKMKT
ncbi:MAG: hypothetical protein N2250_02670, partial [Pseudothermotoga sp.]|nr:hypothetical protein [Pseudothermotoga sp.]